MQIHAPPSAAALGQFIRKLRDHEANLVDDILAALGDHDNFSFVETVGIMNTESYTAAHSFSTNWARTMQECDYPLIPCKPFAELVHERKMDFSTDGRVSPAAIRALYHASERCVVAVLREAQTLALHRGVQYVDTQDIVLARRLLDIESKD